MPSRRFFTRRFPGSPIAASGPITLASDNFNRADETPMVGNWTANTNFANRLNLTGNVVKDPDNTDDASSIYNAVVWPANQWSQCAVTCEETSVGTGMGYGPAVRCQSGSQGRYFLTVNHAATLNLNLFKINGGGTQLGSYTVTYVAGQTVRLEIAGTTLSVYYNGVFIASVTDSDFATGSAGIYASTPLLGTDFLDDWSGGSL